MILAQRIRTFYLELYSSLSKAPLSTALLSVLSLLGVLFFQGYGIGGLEFFRHTEADRTLIAWEMLETRTFLVPHLLGSEILTKPPFFYWMQCLSFYLFQEISESTARIPSLLAAVASCGLICWAFLRAGFSRAEAWFAVLVLASSSQFFLLSRLAEIDMLFGFFSWSALVFLFFAELEQRQLFRSIAYLCLGLSFLTKGPPALPFFFLALLYFQVAFRRYEVAELLESLRAHFFASVLCILPIGVWLMALSAAVGWDTLVEVFQIEVLERALDARRDRGLFFYPFGVFVMMLPWSLVFIAIAIQLFQGKLDKSVFNCAQNSRQKHFLSFCAFCVLGGLIVFSLSAGKSYRYFFPLYFFLASLSAFVLFRFARAIELRPVSRSSADFLMALCSLLFGLAGMAIMQFVPDIEFTWAFAFFLLSGFLAFALFSYSLHFVSKGLLLTSILCFLFCFRFGFSSIYVPHRNASRTVLNAVASIQDELAPGEKIYTLEMYERWVLFYLKQRGHNAFRVTPAMAAAWSESEEEVLLLLNEEEEMWRLKYLREVDPYTRIIRSVKDSRDTHLIVSTKARALQNLDLQAQFPSERTKEPESKSFTSKKHAL